MKTRLSKLASFLKCGGIFSHNKPNTFLIGLEGVERCSQPSPERVSFYAPDFFLEDSNPWWVFGAVEEWTRSELLEALENFQGAICPQLSFSFSSSEPSPLRISAAAEFELFSLAFLDLKKRISTGVLKKGVPTTFDKMDFHLEANHRAWFLKQLLLNTRDLPLGVYGLWNEDDSNQGILGASPEVLFEREIRPGSKEVSKELPKATPKVMQRPVILTAALAGTRLKKGEHAEGSSVAESLMADPKERAEHQWVIHGIQEAISDLGKVCVGKTRVLELPTLFHLYTPIEVELIEPSANPLSQVSGSPASFLTHLTSEFHQLIQSLHPTPALGAFPKKEGWEWLKLFPGDKNRMRFGAPFGVFHPKACRYKCLVGIRNLQWMEDQLLLGAGCGVVEASHLDQEWREIHGKMHSTRRLLGLDADAPNPSRL